MTFWILVIIYSFGIFVSAGYLNRQGLPDVFWASVLWPVVIVAALPYFIGKKIAEWSGY